MSVTSYLPPGAVEPADGSIVVTGDGHRFIRYEGAWFVVEDGIAYTRGPWTSWGLLLEEQRIMSVHLPDGEPYTPDGDPVEVRHPPGARWWAELLVGWSLFAAWSVADLRALGATSWNWDRPAWNVAVYAILIMLGWALQFVLCGWTAHLLVDAPLSLWRGIRRVVDLARYYGARL